MPELQWEGKRDAVNVAKNIPAHLLEFDSASSFGDAENLIVQGDNLLVMKALLPRYKNRVRCIYIDPPYNTHSAFEHYNDNFEHSAWLNLMYPRIELLREFLSDDGAIFISIDDGEVHYLKVICDEIFGRKNFVAMFPWRKRTAKSDVPHGISQDCESILCYAKTDLFQGAVKGKERKYFETDDFPNRPWRHHDLTTQRTASERPNSFFTIVNPKTGEEFPANPNSTWRVTKETFQEYYAANRIIFPGDYPFLKISKPVLRYWKEDDMKKAGEAFGLVAASTFLPAEVGMSQDGTKEITKIFGEKKFTFPKPSSLIQHLISIATLTDKSSIVLDAFAGSGTTAHAVINLNASDGGERKFILIEEKEYCKTITAERVKRVGGNFKFARLGEKLFTTDGTINPRVTAEDLAAHIWFTRTGTALAEKFSLPLIGIHTGSAIYLLENILTREIFNELPIFDGQKIIYGAACRLSEDFLHDNKIIFKHLPKKL